MRYMGTDEKTGEVIVKMSSEYMTTLRNLAMAVAGLNQIQEPDKCPDPDYVMAFRLMQDVTAAIMGRSEIKPLVKINIRSTISVEFL